MVSRVIRRTEGIDSAYLYVGIFFVLLGIIAALSGTAINFGTYGANAEVVDSAASPGLHIYLVRAQVTLGLLMILRAFFYCPIYSDTWIKIVKFREKHKILFPIILFVAIPIFAIICLLTLLALLG